MMRTKARVADVNNLESEADPEAVQEELRSFFLSKKNVELKPIATETKPAHAQEHTQPGNAGHESLAQPREKGRTVEVPPLDLKSMDGADRKPTRMADPFTTSDSAQLTGAADTPVKTKWQWPKVLGPSQRAKDPQRQAKKAGSTAYAGRRFTQKHGSPLDMASSPAAADRAVWPLRYTDNDTPKTPETTNPAAPLPPSRAAQEAHTAPAVDAGPSAAGTEAEIGPSEAPRAAVSELEPCSTQLQVVTAPWDTAADPAHPMLEEATGPVSDGMPNAADTSASAAAAPLKDHVGGDGEALAPAGALNSVPKARAAGAGQSAGDELPASLEADARAVVAGLEAELGNVPSAATPAGNSPQVEGEAPNSMPMAGEVFGAEGEMQKEAPTVGAAFGSPIALQGHPLLKEEEARGAEPLPEGPALPTGAEQPGLSQAGARVEGGMAIAADEARVPPAVAAPAVQDKPVSLAGADAVAKGHANVFDGAVGGGPALGAKENSATEDKPHDCKPKPAPEGCEEQASDPHIAGAGIEGSAAEHMHRIAGGLERTAGCTARFTPLAADAASQAPARAQRSWWSIGGTLRGNKTPRGASAGAPPQPQHVPARAAPAKAAERAAAPSAPAPAAALPASPATDGAGVGVAPDIGVLPLSGGLEAPELANEQGAAAEGGAAKESNQVKIVSTTVGTSLPPLAALAQGEVPAMAAEPAAVVEGCRLPIAPAAGAHDAAPGVPAAGHVIGPAEQRLLEEGALPAAAAGPESSTEVDHAAMEGKQMVGPAPGKTAALVDQEEAEDPNGGHVRDEATQLKEHSATDQAHPSMPELACTGAEHAASMAANNALQPYPEAAGEAPQPIAKAADKPPEPAAGGGEAEGPVQEESAAGMPPSEVPLSEPTGSAQDLPRSLSSIKPKSPFAGVGPEGHEGKDPGEKAAPEHQPNSPDADKKNACGCCSVA